MAYSNVPHITVIDTRENEFEYRVDTAGPDPTITVDPIVLTPAILRSMADDIESAVS